jgi:adenylate kinase
MHVVFLGPPACGKGTQSSALVERFGYQHLSTGDLIRSEIAKATNTGEELKSTINTGKLVDNKIVNELVQKYVEKHTGIGVLFDGYPRTIDQALFVDGLLKEHGTKIKRVFYFDIEPDELMKRILNRVSCASCGEVYNLVTNPTKVEGVCDSCGSTNLVRRADDNEAVLANRISSYFTETKPLKDFYQQRGLLTVVDATLPVHKVTEEIVNAL